MKKILYILSIIFVLITFLNMKNNKVLTDETIRFRIIANSNDINDQNLKKMIKKDLEINLFPLLQNSKSANETRNTIYQNQELIDKIIKKYNVSYDINYGVNFFPKKEYADYIYEEGNYESLVITLGEAKGNNWWCVMYPPLCLIDSSNNNENLEYKFYIKEIINKSQ